MGNGFSALRTPRKKKTTPQTGNRSGTQQTVAPPNLDELAQPTPESMLQLQRYMGNAALQRMRATGDLPHTKRPYSAIPNGLVRSKPSTSRIVQRTVAQVGLIQRAYQDGGVTDNAHLRQFAPAPLLTHTDGRKFYKVDESHYVGHQMKKDFAIQVDKTEVGFTEDVGGWFKAKPKSGVDAEYKGFIRANKLSGDKVTDTTHLREGSATETLSANGNKYFKVDTKKKTGPNLKKGTELQVTATKIGFEKATMNEAVIKQGGWIYVEAKRPEFDGFIRYSKVNALDKVTGAAHARKGEDTKRFDGASGQEYFAVDEDTMVGPKLEQGFDLEVDRNKVGFTGDVGSSTWESKKGWYKAKANDYEEGFIRSGKVNAPTGTAAGKDMSGVVPTWYTDQRSNAAGELADNEGAAWWGNEGVDMGGDILDNTEGTLGHRGDWTDVENLKTVQGGKLVDKDSDDLFKDAQGKVDKTKQGEATNALKEDRADKARTDIAGGVFQGVVGIVNIGRAVRDVIKGEPTEKIAAVMLGVEGLAKLGGGITKTGDAISKLKSDDKKGDSGWDMAGKVGGIVSDGLGAIKSLVEIGIKIYKQIKYFGKTEGTTKARAAMQVISSLLGVAQSTVKVVKGIIDATGGAVTTGLMSAVPGLGIAISAAMIGIRGFNFAKSWWAARPLKGLLQQFEIDEDFQNHVSQETKSRFFGGKQTIREIDEASAKVRLDQLEQKKKAHETDPTANPALTVDEAKELKVLQEWDLTREMKYINTKRETRAVIQIANELVKIGAEIATLSGVGATVGVGMKAGTAAVDIGMVGFRYLKQYIRDKGVGDQGKTSSAKHERRLKHTSLLFKMASELPALPATPTSAQVQPHNKVKILFASTGVDIGMVQHYAQKPDHKKMYMQVYDAMKERE